MQMNYVRQFQYHMLKQADRAGYQTASAVHKRISGIASAYEDFFAAEFQKYLNQ